MSSGLLMAATKWPELLARPSMSRDADRAIMGAMGVSIWERQLIFPAGWHSRMHTLAPEPARTSHANGVP
jgi:hypothetical protein